MKKKLLLSLILAAALAGLWFQYQDKIRNFLFPAEIPKALPEPEKTTPAVIVEPPFTDLPAAPSPLFIGDSGEKKRKDLEELKRQMMASLNKKAPQKRLLAVPQVPPKETEDEFSRPLEKIVAQDPLRAEGIKQRRSFPIGVVIFENVKVFKNPSKKDLLLQMRTGDFVKIFPEQNQPHFLHIHPGAEIYLAATSKKTEVSGTLYPDRDGWIEKSFVHMFDSDEVKEFTETTEPVTLGNDPNFSTVSFYEEAFRNPDPVVHRVIGPRLISILSIHEDYLASWKDLLRDPDSKIRSITLAELKQRGVGRSRPMVEDLITRLSELTREKARGETEAEVMTILNILKESKHPRVSVALSSYVETWEKTQNPSVVAALKETISAAPSP